jgi:hypothetical protein
MLDFNDGASPAFRKASPDPAQLTQEKSEIRGLFCTCNDTGA